MPPPTPTSPQQTSLFGEAELTSLQADSHASPSAQPDSEKARQTTATSGRRCFEQYEKLRPAGSSVKTLTAYLLGTTDWYSKQCALSWKMKVTKSKRFAFQLVPRVRHTDGTDGGLLATPNTMDVLPPKTEKAVLKECTVTRPGRTNFSNLRDQLFHGKLLPTPTSDTDRNQKYAQGGTSLPTALSMLPTPQSRDFRSPDKPDSGNFQRKVKEGYTIDLNSTIAMLPTARSRDWKGITQRGKHAPGDGIANTFAAMEANGTSTGLKLQPAFAFWMMGYPEDWTLRPFLLDPSTPTENGEKNPSKPPETPSSPKSPTKSSKP